MTDIGVLQAVRQLARTIVAPVARILCCLALLAGLVVATTGSADAQSYDPPSRRVCDINVTLLPGQSFTRDAKVDMETGACTGAYTVSNTNTSPGTPSRIQGQKNPNAADAGNRDNRVTNGTIRAVSPDTTQDPGLYLSTPNRFDFIYESIATTAVGVQDNFAVIVYTASGGDRGYVFYHVTFVPPVPTVTSVSPASGGLGQASGIIITGTNFSGATSVTFGGVAATAFTINSNTQITANAPASSSPRTADVVVTTGGGSSSGSLNYRYYAAATNAAAFAPPVVETDATATLTFTLTNPSGNPGSMSSVGFSAVIPSGLVLVGQATTCTGGSVALSGGTISLTNGTIAAGASCTVTANASATAAGSYAIIPGAVSARGARGNAGSASESVVTGGDGAAATLAVSNPAPTVSSISPGGGSTGGGTPVTITGTNFVSGNSYSATFGGATVAAAYASATTLTATAPAGTGTVQVTVANTTTGQAGTGSASYTYATPTVTALSFTSGPAGQARAVTVTGTNFTPSATVSVGGTAATGVVYASSTQLTATLPGLAPGTYDVLVTTGSATSAANRPAAQYTYIAAPTVTSVTPNSGSTAGGTPVTISGTNLNGASSVTFGGNPATNVAVAGDGLSLTATTPSGAAGASTVAVTTAGGIGQLGGGYTYVALAPPGVTIQPQNQTVASGASATFAAEASGSPSPTVQWQVSTNGGATFDNIAGATAPSYTTPATNPADGGKQYRAVFTNSQGSAVTSPATLTVTVPPAVTGNPQDQTVAAGAATSFTAAASGSPTPTVQWQVSTDGGSSFGNIAGATAPTYSFTAAASDNGHRYRAVFTNSTGTATTTAATLTVTTSPTVTSQPANQEVGEGRSVTFTAIASGNPAPAVQWQSSPDGASFADIAGATTESYTFVATAADNGRRYRAVFTGAGTVTSNAATLTVVRAPVANDLAVAAPYRQPGSAFTSVTFAVTASDPQGRPLTFTAVSGPAKGTLTGFTNGAATATYSPNEDARGTDSFRFTASNGVVTDEGVVTFTINGPVLALTTPTATGTIGQPYSSGITVSGGSPPYTIRQTAGALPPGLRFDPVANGNSRPITGTPTTGGTYSFTVQAEDTPTDSNDRAATVTREFTITIGKGQQTITFTSTPPSGAVVGGSYAVAARASSGLTPTITIDGSSAAICTLSGNTVSFREAGSCVVNADQAGDASYDPAPRVQQSITVGAPTVALTPASVPASTVGVAYSTVVSASGGTAPYRFAVTSGALPAGLSLDGDTGRIAGTPTQGGTIAFTINATDSSTGAGAPFTGSRTYTLTVQAPVIVLAPTSLPAGAGGQAYSQRLTASGGTAPYSYAATGPLPAGLALSPAGELSGTPTQAGSFTFDVVATDSSTGSAQSGGRYTGTRTYTLTIGQPTIAITPATLPGAVVGQTYAVDVTASGSGSSYTYSIASGALPAGVTLTAAGRLSGIPTAGGTFTFRIQAADPNGFTGSRDYALGVERATIAVAPDALPDATRGATYSQSLSATGGTAPYNFSASGNVPPGLTLAANGTLSGRATANGSYTFTVTARDSSTGSGPYAATRTYTLAVVAPTIAVGPETLPPATTRVAYSQVLTAAGGTAPYTYAVTAGALPAGVTLATDGTLSGTAGVAGSFSFTVTATDTNGNTGARAFTLTVNAPAIIIAPASLPNGTTRVAYSQALTASGGTGPYGYAVTAGALPGGVTLSTAGQLSGTPSAAGSFTFTVTASDADGNTGARGYTLVIGAPTITLTPATLSDGTYNIAYSADLSATGGTAPYAYAVTAGTLPAGLTLSNGGAVTGTPGAAGSASFTVTATDANGNAGVRGYTLAIGQGSQTISFTDPGSRSLSESPVTLAATASSGLPVSFTSQTSTICTVSGASVTLDRTGTCTIEATQGGNADVVAASPVSRSFAVTAATLVASQAQASVAAQVGAALAPVTPVTVAGGTAPYAYALSGGTLPAGLSFSATAGALSGTPTGGQATTGYTVTVRDQSGQTASGTFTLTVAAPALTVTPTTLPEGAYQTGYSQQLSAAGGTAPYRFAVTGGTLPAGVSLSGEGLLSGTPTAFGRFELTVTATDASTGTGPYSVAQTYALVIQPPAIPTAGDAAATVAYGSANTAITPTLGGEVSSVAIATAPSHGTARVDGRTLLYTPAAGYAGPDSFTYTASNAGGTSAPGTVSVTVSAPAVAITPATLPDARQGDPYSQQLTAAGGAAPYTFTVASGTLPTGLTLSATGAISGTPTSSGSSTFTVRATDASTGTGPFSGTQSYTLTVALPAAPTVRPVPTISAGGSSTASGTPTQIVLSDYVSGNYTGIEVAGQPQNGTVTLAQTGNRVVATYVPRPNFAGTDGFTFVAVGPGGRSPVLAVALSVTGTAPVAAPLTASAVQGVPVTVDLTAAATGGPFTAAAVTSVSPAGSVTAQVVEGGAAGARTYRLTLTPGLAFSGTATISYTLSNQFGASAPAAVTLAVAARADPTGDPNVNAVSAAQADATRRFARAQTDNFFRRNERLHNGGTGTGGRDMGIGLQLGGLGGAMTPGVPVVPDVNDMAMLKSDHAQGALGAELASGAVTMGGGMNGVAGLRGREALQPGTGMAPGLRSNLGQATGEGAGGDVPGAASGERRVGSIGIWSGGAVTVGAWDQDTDRAKLTLSTSGLSAGADVKIADSLIVGVGGGYGADLTRVGGGKARIRGRSWSMAGYGSWSPIEGLFVDGILGAGELSFDTRREVSQTGAIATGKRDGSMLFGSLAAGIDRNGRVDLSAYGRVDYLSARLDRFTEAGGGIYGLTYGRRELESVASVLGLRVGYPLPGWTPRMRGEWRHEFADADAQLIDYADVANLRYATRGDFWLRDAFTIDVGAEFGLGAGWSLTTEVGATAGSGATAGTVRAGVRKEF